MNKKTYDSNGFCFEYPADWTIEAYEDGVSVTSPSETTWTIRRFPADMNAEDFLQEVADALEEEYDSIDTEKTEEEINSGLILETWEMDFYCMDLPCVARAQVLKTPFALYFMFSQADSQELDDAAPMIDDIVDSWLEPFRQMDVNAGLSTE